MERITTIATRLKEYRDIYNLTLADMEKLTRIPAQTINRYELGQRIPKIDVAISIAESLSINPLWLQGYKVPMEGEKPTKNSELSKTKQAIIEKIMALDDLQVETLNQIVDSILQLREKETN